MGLVQKHTDSACSDTLRDLDIIGFEKECANCETLNELTGTMSVKFTSYGFAWVAYQHVSEIGSFDYNRSARFYTYGVPKDRLEIYKQGFSKNMDPIMEYLLSNGRSEWLSEMEADQCFDSESIAAYIRRLRNTSFGEALGIPLYGPYHRRGFLVLGCARKADNRNKILKLQLTGLGRIMHMKYCQIIKDLQRSIQLTDREAEVIELVALGKTNVDIGTVLGISSNTVNSYLKRIFLKLNATDRVSASMRAMALDLIK